MINLFAVLLLLVSTLLAAGGAWHLKKASAIEWKQFFHNKPLVIAVLFYGVSGIFYLSALKLEQLSVTYPFVSLTYVWTVILSVKYLGERINRWKYIGLTLILMGIAVIGRGG